MHEIPSWLALTGGGALGALTNAALGARVIALPHLKGHQLHMGFAAQLVICIGVAHAVDHDFQTAFFASLCGTALLRQVKRRLESSFTQALKELERDE